MNQETRPQRKSIRAREYDYSSPGAYFLTVCVKNNRSSLANVDGTRHQMTRAGQIVEAAWHDLPNRFDWLELDAFVVMPNHIHGILIIKQTGNQLAGETVAIPGRQGVGETGVMNHAPTRRRFREDGYAPIALGEVVRTLKAAATRSIRKAGYEDFEWQRNYYEHIIRSDRSLERIREYIDSNPAKWAEDRYFVNEAARV